MMLMSIARPLVCSALIAAPLLLADVASGSTPTIGPIVVTTMNPAPAVTPASVDFGYLATGAAKSATVALHPNITGSISAFLDGASGNPDLHITQVRVITPRTITTRGQLPAVTRYSGNEPLNFRVTPTDDVQIDVSFTPTPLYQTQRSVDLIIQGPNWKAKVPLQGNTDAEVKFELNKSLDVNVSGPSTTTQLLNICTVGIDHNVLGTVHMVSAPPGISFPDTKVVAPAPAGNSQCVGVSLVIDGSQAASGQLMATFTYDSTTVPYTMPITVHRLIN
jgi:hypothetical protein